MRTIILKGVEKGILFTIYWIVNEIKMFEEKKKHTGSTK